MEAQIPCTELTSAIQIQCHFMSASADTHSERPKLPLPDTIVSGEIRWVYAVPIIGIHILALLAVFPWFFSWTGLILMVVGVHFYGQAINLCYHRLLTHRSAKVPKWLEHFFVVIALCCMEDTPGKWVAMHRYHHKHSDHVEDPHSPLVTFLWAHMGWLMIHNRSTHNIDSFRKYAPDILRDRFYMKLEKSYAWVWIYIGHVLLYFIIGFIIGALMGGWYSGLQFGASLMIWGALVRTVVVWHITWSVNSLTHLFGYSNYETDDCSRNNWFVALLTVGEGWHNNHHHDQMSASNQHRWWELDITYYQIRILEFFGLASDVIKPKHIRNANRKSAREKAIASVNTDSD